ncbi:MAG TPA: DNA cytosine methyltransferase [Allosphingosinicella sp.]|nr:DNA cytosine methyltransferase [Allosphingosinicella sp.]
MAQPRFIDVFTGCGGLSLGLANAGWNGVLAIEKHPDAFATLRHNLIDGTHAHYDWPEWFPIAHSGIEEVLEQHLENLSALKGTIDLIAGGPPCQGFSAAGRRNPEDPRNRLVQHYLRLIKLLEPPLILMENVRGFTNMRVNGATGMTYSDHVSQELRGMGYDVWTALLMASDWGVPQRRPRFFIVAVQQGRAAGIDPFLRLRVGRRAFLRANGLPEDGPVTAKMALQDLELAGSDLIPYNEGRISGFQQLDYQESERASPYARLMRKNAKGSPDCLRLPRHSATIQTRFRQILETCTAGRHLSDADRAKYDTKKRSLTPLAADQPACTITTLPDDVIHYSEPRILTVRECARLQSFPDWFSFRGPYTTGGDRRRTGCPRYTQVGNAVPPLLAKALGEMLFGLRGALGDKSTKPLEVVEMTGEAGTKGGEILPSDGRIAA